MNTFQKPLGSRKVGKESSVQDKGTGTWTFFSYTKVILNFKLAHLLSAIITAKMPGEKNSG